MTKIAGSGFIFQSHGSVPKCHGSTTLVSITISCVADGEEYVGEDQTVYEEQKFIFVRLSVLREYLRCVIQHCPTYKVTLFNYTVSKIMLQVPVPMLVINRSKIKSTASAVAKSSVADPVPGSGAFLTLDPGYGVGFFRIPDPGSKTHIFYSLITNFWVKSTIILSALAKKISLPVQI